jgi:cyclic pyranopterin phosphate synthase
MNEELRKFRMADITSKDEVARQAVAVGRIKVRPETIELIKRGETDKGDPLAVAEVAAIMAAKNTCQLIPFCHPIPITNVEAKAKLLNDCIEVETCVKTDAKTGVEMEALVSATAYLLTIWDMVKKHEKDERGQYPVTTIEYVKVKSKLKATENE